MRTRTRLERENGAALRCGQRRGAPADGRKAGGGRQRGTQLETGMRFGSHLHPIFVKIRSTLLFHQQSLYTTVGTRGFLPPPDTRLMVERESTRRHPRWTDGSAGGCETDSDISVTVFNCRPYGKRADAPSGPPTPLATDSVMALLLPMLLASRQRECALQLVHESRQPRRRCHHRTCRH